MAEKGMPSNVITTALLSVVEEMFSKMTTIIPTASPESKLTDIVEYGGRMRVGGMEKFDAPSIVSVVNFYSSQSDLEKHKAKGALVLYTELENASKLYKALGFPVSEDEDDSSMRISNGKICALLTEGFKNELSRQGYMELVTSTVGNYKNTVMEGIEYSKDQQTKFEFNFFYWKHKAIVIELTLALIPLKR